ncbi:MAG TPA: phage tail assembly chaperone [Allosphingosinicella sp.]
MEVVVSPEPRFSDGAARLAGLAGALLGWRPDEFWRATPAEFAAVLGVMVPKEGSASAEDLARLKEMYPDG